jgi:hypothetical protein
MTVGKSAGDLESMLMERLRGNASCAALYRVVVIPEGDEGGWRTRCEAKMGMTILATCERTVNVVAADLRRQYHLARKTEACSTGER